MKKVYLIPETSVRKPILLSICQLSITETPADPTLPVPVEGKERVDEEKGFGSYEW